MPYRNLMLPIILWAVCIALTACSSSRLSTQEKALIKQQQAQYVVNSITESRFVIQLDRVTARGGTILAQPSGYGPAG